MTPGDRVLRFLLGFTKKRRCFLEGTRFDRYKYEINFQVEALSEYLKGVSKFREKSAENETSDINTVPHIKPSYEFLLKKASILDISYKILVKIYLMALKIF